MRREAAAISPITDIVADIRAGRIVVLVDDEDRENEGDLVFAADFVSADKINFLAAHDRALTVKVAAARDARPEDIVQPGHIFPLVAQPGGVLVRAGHTEACCDLARLAGLTPAAVLCEIMRDDGSMARLPDLMQFAAQHQLKIGTIADLIEY